MFQVNSYVICKTSTIINNNNKQVKTNKQISRQTNK